MKISINPKKEIFYWIADSNLLYPDYFQYAFMFYGKRFYPWPEMLVVLEKNKYKFIIGNEELNYSSEKNFFSYAYDAKKYKKYFSEWIAIVKKLHKIQKSITTEKLSRLEDKNLGKLFISWDSLYRKFWIIGELPELSVFAAKEILQKELRRYKNIKNKDEVIVELLKVPKLTFYQQAEKELLAIKKYQKIEKIFSSRIKKHQRKYFFILNSYLKTQVLSEKYFEIELKKYSEKEAIQEYNKLKNLPANIKKIKKNLAYAYNFNRRTVRIAEQLSSCIWWQDVRKFNIFWALHCLQSFVSEYSRRYKIPESSLLYYSRSELFKLATRKEIVSKKIISDRKELTCIIYFKKINNVVYITGNKAKKIRDTYITKQRHSEKEINGIVASGTSVIKGKVRIIKTPEEIKKIKKGEIMLTEMTTPDFITAIKKAKAVVTDYGGLTCHAAVVCRELGIPCIVGTKIATESFKNGEKVIVDTKRAFIKKI